ARARLEEPAVLDDDHDRRATLDREGALRSGERRRRIAVAAVQVHHMAVDANALFDVDDPVDDLDLGRFQQRLPADRRRTGRLDAHSGDARYSLFAARSSRSCDGDDRLCDAARVAARLLHDEATIPLT